MLMQIDRHNSVLAVIDMQEKLLSAIDRDERNEIIKNTNLLLKCAEIFEIPVIVTEQYPSGLGSTSKELVFGETLHCHLFEKVHFSIFKNDAVREHIRSVSRQNIVFCGIESHICVLQSAFASLQNGMNAYVSSDAVASRRRSHKNEALDIMRNENIHVCPAETLSYIWLEEAGTPEFRKILPLIKD